MPLAAPTQFVNASYESKICMRFFSRSASCMTCDPKRYLRSCIASSEMRNENDSERMGGVC